RRVALLCAAWQQEGIEPQRRRENRRQRNTGCRLQILFNQCLGLGLKLLQLVGCSFIQGRILAFHPLRGRSQRSSGRFFLAELPLSHGNEQHVVSEPASRRQLLRRVQL